MAQALPAQVSTNAPSTNKMERMDEVVITGARDSSGSPTSYVVPDATSSTKMETPLRDVPQSIQVVPSRVIKDQQALVLEDAVRNVSGVYRENTFGNTLDRFSLRGFSQTDFLRDGYRDPQGQVRSLSGTERVEVVKGPASILFGRLEPGGVINVVSKRPLAEPAFSAEFQAGSYDFYRGTLDATGPVTKDGSVLFRASGSYERSGTFRQPSEVDIERIDFSPSLTLNLGDATEIWLQFNYIRSDRQFDRGLVAVGTGVADIPNDRFLGEPGDFLHNDQVGFVGELKHQFNADWRLRQGIRGSWYDSNDYRAEPTGNVNAAGNLNRQFSMNDDHGFSIMTQTDVLGHLETGSVEHDVLGGFDMSRDERGGINGSNGTLIPINIYNPVYGAAPLPITAWARDDRNTTDGLGIYLQDQITLLENVKLLVGGRLDSVEYTGRSFLPGGTIRKQSDQAFTPRAGVVYQPVDPVSLYFSYSEGFNPVTSGAIFGGGLPTPTTGSQYEAGAKTEFFEGRLSSTLSVFHLTKQDVSATDPLNPGFIVQLGEVRSRGVELDVSGRILPGWDVIASYAYIDACITEDTVPGNIGRHPASVPEHGASLWSVYRVQSGPLAGLGFGGGLYYVGERMGDAANTFTIPAYVRTDAAVFYEREHWRAAVNVKNIFDQEYIAASSSRTRIDPGAPLTVIGSISLSF